jgi:hypothetical protein
MINVNNHLDLHDCGSAVGPLTEIYYNWNPFMAKFDVWLHLVFADLDAPRISQTGETPMNSSFPESTDSPSRILSKLIERKVLIEAVCQAGNGVGQVIESSQE